jgi:hypothetical protein
MEKQRFKTKLELINELGLSKATFYRLLRKKNIQTTREMLCPKTENELRLELGFLPLPGFESSMVQIETNRDNKDND